MIRAVKIGDIFDVVKGKSLYTKTYGITHKGEYPVFSASHHAPLTHINHYDFDGKYITRATNGFAGYIKLIEGKFNINGDRGVLVPKQENIDIDYIKHSLQPILRNLAKGRKGDNAENEFTKVYPRMVEQVEIKIPVDEKGNFDLQAQKEIADEYITIDELKNKIKGFQEKIEKLQVQVEQDKKEMKKIKIEDIVHTLGVPLKIQKEDLQGKGNIPTYSSQIEDEGLMGYYTTAMYKCSKDRPLITFGDHTKAIYIRTSDFAIVDNVKVLELKPEYIGKINIHYIIDKRKPIIPSLGYARHRKEGKKSVISIPTLPDGSFDLARQQEISQIYETIVQIKQQMIKKLEELQKIQVTL